MAIGTTNAGSVSSSSGTYKSYTIPANSWVLGAPEGSTAWYTHTVTDSEIKTTNAVLAYGADDASIEECKTVCASIETTTGGFILKSNQQHDKAINLQYTILKADEGGAAVWVDFFVTAAQG